MWSESDTKLNPCPCQSSIFRPGEQRRSLTERKLFCRVIVNCWRESFRCGCVAVFSYFNASARQGDRHRQARHRPPPPLPTGEDLQRKNLFGGWCWCWAGGCGCGAAATSSLTHAQLRGSATAPRPPKIRGPPALVLAGERGQCGHGGEKAPHHCSSMRQPGRAASWVLVLGGDYVKTMC